MNDRPLREEIDGGVATLILDDPDTRNALSREMLDALEASLLRIRATDDVRVVVLASSHPKVFSSGANLGGFAADTPLVEKHREMEQLPRIFTLLRELGKPSICAVGGHALAGSIGLMLSCDLVIAAEQAEFATPEINVGAFPYMIMALIYRTVGRLKANELMLLGRRITAAEAAAAGLVNRVVPGDELDAAVADWSAALASRSPLLMRLGKDAMRRQADMPLDDAFDFLRGQLALTFSTDDLAEGVASFFEKREPRWKGR